MRHPLSLTAVCAMLLTAGCATAEGGASGTGDAKAAASASAVGTRAVRAALDVTGRTTAHTEQTVELTANTMPPYVISASGAYDFAAHRGTASVGLADVARFQEVFTDARIYLRGTAGAESMPWSYIDRADADATHLLRSPGNDPEYTLRQAALGEEFELVGKERTNGAPTTHYRGLLPHKALTLRMTKDAREQADQMRDLLHGRIPATADVWVDAEKRVVRVKFTSDIARAGVLSVSTLTLTKLGEP
ncbi:hypothetical protein OIB37_31735 [Streptomyces sp. NBC_00820]|uniref:hypothetical protein n=1 Tax=Streptomyces sp. NBC_00820 TaxID=2975842 RepID=UPI002ED2D987|nr:hypothetical protein OIB37_31735 [Streptomyces sp. NBC_00820]